MNINVGINITSNSDIKVFALMIPFRCCWYIPLSLDVKTKGPFQAPLYLFKSHHVLLQHHLLQCRNLLILCTQLD